MSGFQSRKLADPVTRKALGDIGLQSDFAEIARILAIAEPLRKALDVVIAAATRGGQAQGRHIRDFSAEAVTVRAANAHNAPSIHPPSSPIDRIAVRTVR